MPEHLIRLRGPWELLVPTDSRVEHESGRIILPAAALPDGSHPITLRRHFGRPLRSSESVSCRLRCEAVPGLLAIRLNGDLLMERSPEEALSPDPIELPIPRPLRLRNQVEFTALGDAARFASSETPWGSVVLVFRENTEPPSC